ncbi:MAG: 30S ribosomal protein S8 [Candidatus Aenigmatarchaeota archaeon]
MLQDTLADVLSAIKNSEKDGKRSCVAKASKLAKAVLEIMQERGYIGAFEIMDDGKGGMVKIELTGKIIDCNAIKPRSSVAADGFERWEKRYLPAREFGILIVSTSRGVMDHKRAKEANIGGKLVAYVY